MITTASPAETFGLPINQSVAFSNHKGVFKERHKNLTRRRGDWGHGDLT
jgi:hypothetical protein